MVEKLSRAWLPCMTGMLLVLACGDKARPPTNAEDRTTSSRGGGAGESSSGDGGETTSAGPASTSSSGNAGGTGGAPSSAGPEVEVIAPRNASGPEEVFNTVLEASCRVVQAQDGAPPDASTITIDLLDEEGELLNSQVGSTEGEPANHYGATFQVQNVSAGRVTVRCSAADTLQEPRVSSHEIVTYIDHGPLVTIVSPREAVPEAATAPVVFEYVVLPDDLVADDEGAQVEEVSLTVKGVNFDIQALADDENTYRSTIDFADPSVFAEVPEGSVSVALSATNARGITQTERYDFSLDSKGPDLSIDAPGNGAVVGGTVNLTLSLPDDGSGVDLDSLKVLLNEQEFAYDVQGPWAVDGDEVSFQFESASVEGSLVQLNVNVHVRDNVGNESSASALYYKDNYPPIVMLEAPPFRGRNVANNTCSHSFNPLGSAVGHADAVVSNGLFRALVWDVTNSAGSGFLYYATTDRSSVQLFIRIPDQPLVVDTTGDGVCDDIFDEQNVRFQQLTALTPVGSPWFGTLEEDASSEPPMGECSYGTSAQPPNALCGNLSDLRTVANHNITGGDEAVVYAMLPSNSGPDCTGRPWELPAVVPNYEGWVCLAARAYDRVGNRGISKPIAVCLDNAASAGSPSCTTDVAEVPPSCQSDCSDPAALPATGVIYNR